MIFKHARFKKVYIPWTILPRSYRPTNTKDTKNEEGRGYKEEEVQAKGIPRMLTEALDVEHLVY